MIIVVFDIGRVLVPEGDRVQRLQKYLASQDIQLGEDQLMQAYWAYRDAYDLGMADEEYWWKVLGEAGVNKSSHPQLNTQELGELDGERNAVLAPETAELIDDLLAHQIPVGLLSNAPVSMAEAVATSDWGRRIPVKVFSSSVGFIKPDEQIYSIAEQMLSDTWGNHNRADVVFFDDRKCNVDAANQFGWNSKLWEGVSEARKTLGDLGVDVNT